MGLRNSLIRTLKKISVPERFAIFIVAVSAAIVSFGAVFVPSGFSVKEITAILRSPTAMALSPDGRIFVCEQGGRVRVIRNDTLLIRPFLSVAVDSSTERGLIGITFDPMFTTNGYVYVTYTTASIPKHNRVSRFTASEDTALAGSEQVVIDLDSLSGSVVHNGGSIRFGSDGTMYIGVGDNGNSANAQSMNNVFGKILRINPDGTIPTDNPFYATATGNNRAIWARGLRNPFTFAIQSGTGRMFINDVGQVSWEEINDGIAGSNYGWPATEGYTANPLYRSPIYTYPHGSTDSTGCAITGGDFYNPLTVQFPSSYVGNYFYVDHCMGWMRLFHPADSTTSIFATGLVYPVDVHVDTGGSLFYLTRGTGATTGTVGKIQYSPGQAATFSLQPTSVTVQVGQTAVFSAIASGDPPITYRWQRNGVTINNSNTTTLSFVNAQLANNGDIFRCIATNPHGNVFSQNATLTVVADQPPTATINDPSPGATYRGGDTISYAGAGTDPEEGSLPSSAYTWQIDFHHNTHHHPFMLPTSGATSGSFVVPVNGETSDSVWYRITLVVRDSSGLADTAIADVLPVVTADTLKTIPSGLTVLLDGQPHATPYVFNGVVGIQRTLSVASPQSSGGKVYDFSGWSDGGAISHVVSTPATDSAFTASFTQRPDTLKIATTSPLPTGTALVPYFDTLAATGGVPPYSWSLITGALPQGVTLTSAGILSGIPTTGGIFSLTVQVTDSTDSTASKLFALVLSNPTPSEISLSPTSKVRGSPGFIVTVTGSNFVNASTVRFDGATRPTTFVNSSTVTAFLFATDVSAAGTHTVTIFSPTPGGGTSNGLTFAVTDPVLSVKAYLQGPFVGGSMSSALRSAGIIPLAQPYSAPPWLFGGGETVASIPAGVVDWVLLELRSGLDASTMVSRRAAFLRNDGAIVDLDGSGPVVFTGVNAGSYYVVVHHRNHLSVMSSVQVTLNDAIPSYDFSTGSTQFYGGDAANLGGGIFGLYSGDYSRDGFIDSDDFLGPDNEVFFSGYRLSDLNMDGFVDSDDFINSDNNVFKSTSVPK